MIASIVSLLLSVAPPLPPSFVPPKGWVAKPLPPSTQADYIWLSPHFGIDGNGENLLITTRAVAPGSSLAAVVRSAIAELRTDRSITGSHSDPTCGDRQPGWAFVGSVSLPNGQTVEQRYHMAIYDGRVWMFVLTHAAGDPVDPAVDRSIQSLCPATTTAS